LGKQFRGKEVALELAKDRRDDIECRQDEAGENVHAQPASKVVASALCGPGSFSSPLGNAYWVALLLVAVAIITPIWPVGYPGMVDYPNHLTRCYILAHFHDNPVWQTRYYVDREPLPNLAIDLIVVPLNHFLPIALSGKIFLTLTALLYVLGCAWLGYAVTAKRSWVALIAAFTFHNSTLLFGFVNYVFGVGVFLCGFAFWMQSRHRMSWLRFSICCLFSLAAFLAHLSAIVFLGVGCTTIALLELRSHRSALVLIRQLAWLACPIIAMAGFLKGSGKVGRVGWSTLTKKFILLFIPVRSYSLTLDVIVLAILAGCVLLMARRARIHSVWVVGLVMFVLFLITPNELFLGSALDARYVLPATLLLLLSVDPRWDCLQKLAFGIALFVMVLHTADIAWNWVAIDRRQQHVLALGAELPNDARVFVMPYSAVRTPGKLDRGFHNLVTLWTISHEADVSSLFSLAGQQPLVARHPPLCLDDQWMECVGHYDFILTDNPTPATEKLVRSVADQSAAWDSVTLWRIRHSSRDHPQN